MEYPKMIYRGGDLSADWRIVEDAEGEAAAGKEGFYAHDSKKAAPKGEPEHEEAVKERKKPGPKPKAAQ